MVLDEIFAHSSKQSNGSRSSVKVRSLPLVDKVPVSGCGGINGSRLEDGRGDSVGERSIDNVRVTSDPTHVGHACEFVFGMGIKDVFDSEIGTEEVSTGAVNHSLGFTGRAGCLGRVSAGAHARVLGFCSRRG